MSSPETVEFVKEAVRAVNGRDDELIRKHFSRDVTYVIRGDEYDRSALLTPDDEQQPVELVDLTFDMVAVENDHATVYAQFEYDLIVDFYGISPDSTYVTPAAIYLEFDDGSIDYMRTLSNSEDMLATCGFLSDSMAGGGVGPDLIPDRIRVEFREVTMRFLRHNIRNEVEVIRAVSEDLRPSDEQLAELLTNAANDLATTATKAWETEKDLLNREPTYTSVSLSDLVEQVLEEAAGETARGTTHTVDDPQPVRTDGKLVETAVTEVIDNAARHTDGHGVTATVRPADASEYTTELIVVDEGPGIPESELAPIREGEETELQHTSSIGLWRVKWYTDRVRGDVEFTSPDAGGTRVRMRFPSLDEDH